MKKYSLTTMALILLVFWPTMAQEVANPAQVAPERVHSVFEERYLGQLRTLGKDLDAQGLYIESLDGSMVLADHQSKVAFNPASVIKIATSFAALDKLGPEYRFETAFEALGEIKKTTRTLEGDLVLASTGDPELTTLQVNRLVQDVIRAGVTNVTGSLVVTGPFTYATYVTTEESVTRLEATLKRMGVRVTGRTKRASVNGIVLGNPMLSRRLREIIKAQNDASINRTADRLGEAVGGPRAVTDFLVKDVGIARNDVYISHTSGLMENKITPQGTVQLLRHLVLWLNFNNLLPQDVLPVAGVEGTLRARLTNVDYKGSVIGKTGTLPATDGGVSTLAGFVFTKDRGVLIFAIFNTRGNVNTFRRLQDSLIKDLIGESGGAELSASLHKSSN